MSIDWTRALSFGAASVLTAPFAGVLIAVYAALLHPSFPPPVGLAVIVLYGYYFIPSIWGILGIAAASASVAIAFAKSKGQRRFTYPLIFYCVVLGCAIAYAIWWHASGQQWASL